MGSGWSGHQVDDDTVTTADTSLFSEHNKKVCKIPTVLQQTKEFYEHRTETNVYTQVYTRQYSFHVKSQEIQGWI